MDVSSASQAGWDDLALNVLGGVIAAVVYALLLFLVVRIVKRYSALRYSQLLGPTARESPPSIVYSSLQLPPEHLNPDHVDFPYAKPGMPDYTMRTSSPAPVCDLRAASYLMKYLGENTMKTSSIDADTALFSSLNLNLIALGFGSNYKTRDLLDNPSNVHVQADFVTNEFLIDGSSPWPEPRTGYDYGILLFLKPEQFPERRWVACCGLDEWGTSGGAWLLANKSKEVLARLRKDRRDLSSQCFGLVVEVRREKDESVRILRTFGEERTEPFVGESIAASLSVWLEEGLYGVVRSLLR